MPDSQHASKVISHLILWLVLAVHCVDELIEGFLYGSHIDLILVVHALSQIVCHITVDILTGRDQVLLYPRQRVMLLYIQVDYLVWDYAHSLQGKRLYTRPWETLDDPTLSFRLKCSDFFLDQLDHDLIINYSKRRKYIVKNSYINNVTRSICVQI